MTVPDPRLAAEVLGPYIEHWTSCFADDGGRCTCGLDAALASLAAPPDPVDPDWHDARPPDCCAQHYPIPPAAAPSGAGLSEEERATVERWVALPVTASMPPGTTPLLPLTAGPPPKEHPMTDPKLTKRLEAVLPWLWVPIMVGGVVYLALANGVR